jgi:hypothetical protein
MEIRTSHAFVLRHYFGVDNILKVQPTEQHTLESIQNTLDIAEFIGDAMPNVSDRKKDRIVRSVARYVQKTVEKFEASADRQVSESHVYFRAKQINSPTTRTAWRRLIRSCRYVSWAQEYFDNVHEKCQEVRDLGTSGQGISYDAFMKVAQLDGLPLSFNAVAIDEAQDMTPCQAALFWGEKNRGKRITYLFGDQWQQLYRFRGASECFKSTTTESSHELYLTGTFRFGKIIAEAATSILRHLGGPNLIGLATDNGTVQPQSEYRTGVVLCRTNNGLFKYLLYERPRRWAFLNPKAKLPKISEWMLNLETFLNGGRDTFRRGEETFESPPEIEEYLDDEDDIELLKLWMLLKLLKEKEASLHDFYEEIRKSYCPLRQDESADEYAGVILSTTHNAKGLEFKNVCIYDDFCFGVLEHCLPSLSEKRLADEANLVYVAITRCKSNLFLSEAAFAFLRSADPNSEIFSDTTPLRQRRQNWQTRWECFVQDSTPISKFDDIPWPSNSSDASNPFCIDRAMSEEDQRDFLRKTTICFHPDKFIPKFRDRLDYLGDEVLQAIKDKLRELMTKARQLHRDLLDERETRTLSFGF